MIGFSIANCISTGRNSKSSGVRLKSLIVLSLALCGCNTEPPAQPQVRDAAETAGTQQPLGASVSSEDGAAKSNKELPADLPLFPDSTIVSSFNNSSFGQMTEVRSPGLVNVIHEFYESELKKNGWEIIKADVSDGGVHLRADKDDRRVDIGLSWKDGATFNRIIISSKENYIPQNFNFGEGGESKQGQP